MSYQSTKLIDGFSTCFRQWRAEDTHCKYLHGYAISFKITFEAFTLDHRNWVQDFGFMSRSTNKIDQMTPKQWFKHWFDHTVVISDDDPKRKFFDALNENGAATVRYLPQVGCEMFAEFVFKKLDHFVSLESNGRVRVKKVQCFEHNKNSAIYEN